MRLFSRAIVHWLFICLLGCSSNSPKDPVFSATGARSELASPINARLIQKSASMSIEVDSVKDATIKATQLIDSVGGYVETTDSYSEESTSITVKVPSEKLNETLQALSKIGDVTYERTGSRDVTDEVVDVEARLENLIELRARFRQLLAKAEKVDEIISVERELSRIQTEIDAIETRKKMLIGKVEQAEIDIRLKQKRVLGPLGYLGKGIFWAISKLFVIK